MLMSKFATVMMFLLGSSRGSLRVSLGGALVEDPCDQFCKSRADVCNGETSVCIGEICSNLVVLEHEYFWSQLSVEEIGAGNDLSCLAAQVYVDQIRGERLRSIRKAASFGKLYQAYLIKDPDDSPTDSGDEESRTTSESDSALSTRPTTPDRSRPVWNDAEWDRLTEKDLHDIPRHSFQEHVGLVNSHNTCYLNSIMQVLLHSRVLNKILEEPGVKVREAALDSVAHEFFRLREVIHVPSSRKASPGTDALRAALAKLHPGSYLLNEMVDASEALIHIWESLEKCIIKKGRRNPSYMNPAVAIRNERSVLCTSCEKSHSHFTTESILWLPVPQQIDGTELTLKDCFSQAAVDEIIEGYECAECNPERPPAVISQRIVSSPEILFIALRRFKADGTLNNAKVEIPLIMDLAEMPGVDLTQNSYETTIYKLCGVVFHLPGHDKDGMPSPASGHYVGMYRDDENGIWRVADDSTVDPTNLANKKLQPDTSYILMYEKHIAQSDY